jgi:UDP:flavonoid glycosyltransferase YjiC (YdhE family)
MWRMLKSWWGRGTPATKGGKAPAPIQQRKTALLVWELGRGLGHIHRLLPVARELRARGHRVVFALRELTEANQIAAALPQTEIVPAPFFVPDGSTAVRRNSATYADMLHECGYAKAADLAPLVALWQGLLDSFRPAVVVADHSPTAVIAAAGLVPVVVIGSGFAVPPAGVPFATLYPPAADGVEAREEAVLGSIREVRGALGLTPPTRTEELFSWAETYPCSLPELDPYRAVRRAPAIGPMHRLPHPVPAAAGAPEFVFGYLAGDDPRVPRLLRSLAGAKVPCSLYVRQAPPPWAEALAGTTVKLFDAPRNLSEIVGAASAVLHHGGVSTTETALAIGRPQFLLPRYVEQGLTTESIVRLGCGLNLAAETDDWGKAIRKALREKVGRAQSRGIAEGLAERPISDVKARVVAACLRHLES